MFRSALVAAAVAVSTLSANAAFAYTIGYVDTQKVLMSYQGARSAQAEMQKELQQYQQEFAARQKKIAEAQKAGKSQAELQKMTAQYEQELAPLKQRAQSLEAKLSANVKTKVEAQITQIAKRRHVDVVIDKAAVLYGGVDLTPDVLNALK
jgi:outer membrane protein